MSDIERRLNYARAIWTAVVGNEVADDDLMALNGYMDGADAAITVADDELRGAVSALDLARGTLKRVAEGCEEPAFGAAMCLKAIDHLHPGGQ
jgi:hypothetical protein